MYFMAEDLDIGPGGIVANSDWKYFASCPSGYFLYCNFTFNALWSNMIWICNGVTHEKLDDRNNNGKDGIYVTDVNTLGTTTFPLAFVAYHKLVSWGVDHPERFPWRQSPMAVLEARTQEGVDGHIYARLGFNDEGGRDWDNAVCIVTRVKTGE
jgi:hypothetical protein